jgi:hypothetical protein
MAELLLHSIHIASKKLSFNAKKAKPQRQDREKCDNNFLKHRKKPR